MARMRCSIQSVSGHYREECSREGEGGEEKEGGRCHACWWGGVCLPR